MATPEEKMPESLENDDSNWPRTDGKTGKPMQKPVKDDKKDVTKDKPADKPAV